MHVSRCCSMAPGPAPHAGQRDFQEADLERDRDQPPDDPKNGRLRETARLRTAHYPISEAYVDTIERLLENPVTASDPFHLTISDITARIRRDGFTGSYDAVRRYMRSRGRNDIAAWERAYRIVLKLPAPRESISFAVVRRQCAPAGIQTVAPVRARSGMPWHA